MKTKVIETYHHDGDQTYYWSSVKEALKSGRFDYLEDTYDEDIEDETFDEFWSRIENSKSVKELIEIVGYPFYLED